MINSLKKILWGTVLLTSLFLMIVPTGMYAQDPPEEEYEEYDPENTTMDDSEYESNKEKEEDGKKNSKFIRAFFSSVQNNEGGVDVPDNYYTKRAKRRAELRTKTQGRRTLRGLFGSSSVNAVYRYKRVYRTLHREHKQDHNSMQKMRTAPTGSAEGVEYLKYISDENLTEGAEVFGFHPFWMGETYKSYTYNLLSTVAFFSYDVNPSTGGPVSKAPIDEWLNTSMVDSAKQAGCKVVLSVTNHGYKPNKEFLDLPAAQNLLIDSLLSLVEARDANGVNIDFELIPSQSDEKFTKFIKTLSTTFKNRNPEYQISVCLPAFNHKDIIQVNKLSAYVDLFIIMGYDFHGSTSTAGPIAPLPPSEESNDENQLNLMNSVDLYLKAGIPKSKLILGLPYYGAVWESPSINFKHQNASFRTHVTYKQLRTNFAIEDALYDSTSTSLYLTYKDGGKYKQVWFDVDSTISKKYDYAINKKLKGVAIWSLGYDNGFNDLWGVIHSKYTDAGTASAKKGAGFSILRTLRNHSTVVLICGIFLVTFLVLGIVVSLFDPKVREILFDSNAFRFFYIAVFFTIIALLLTASPLRKLIRSDLGMMAVGLIIGLILTYFVSSITLKRKQDIP